MADQARLQIVIEALNNAGAELKALQADLKGTSEASAAASEKLSQVGDAGKGAGKGLDEAGEKSRSAGEGANEGAKGFESFAGKLVAIQSGIGIAKEALGGLKEVWDFAKQGAENQRIAESFKRTAESIGSNADDIVAKLDNAARGTVDDEELMQASTRAMTLGVAKSGDDLVNVMQLARAASVQFGGDAGQAFESINQAIGNLAPRALKQFGIIVDLKEANEAYAKAIGSTADALTEEQQRQALLNAVLEQGAKNFGDVGSMATTTAEKMKAVEVRLGNILDVFKEIAATGIGTALDIGDAPGNVMKAFTGTAEKMRVEVAAGRMTATDYNAALDGMAQAMRDGGFVMRQVDLDAAKLSVNLDGAAKGAYGFADGLDESNRAARRTADATELLARQQEQLTRVQAQATQGAYGWNGALDESNRAALRVKEATKNLSDEMDLLKIGMSGALQNETEQFGKKQEDLATKAAKVKAELDKLTASQGQAVTSTKKHGLSANEAALAQIHLAQAERELATESAKGTLSAEQIAAAEDKIALNRGKLEGVTKTQIASSKQLAAANEALKSAQADLNNNTNPEKQLELAIKVDKLKESLGQASGAVTSYVDNSKKIGELKGQYDEINREIEANAAAHEEATRRILFGYAEQQLAIGGTTEAEFKALDALAVRWGLKSQEDITAMQAIRDAAAGLAKDGSINEFVGTIDRSAGEASTVFDGMAQDMGSVASAHDVMVKTMGVPLPDQAPVDMKVTTENAHAAIQGVIGDAGTAKDKISAPIPLTVDKNAAETSIKDLLKMPPISIPAKINIETVEDKTKAVAGDSAEERRKQLTGGADNAAKSVQDSTKRTLDAVTDIATRTTDKITGVTADTKDKLDGLATTTQVKFSNVSSSIATSMITMGAVAGGAISSIALMIAQLPTSKTFTYVIKTIGEVQNPGGAPSRALGGPTGAGGLYNLHPNEWVLSEAQRYGRAPIPAEAIPASSPGGKQIIDARTQNIYLQDTLATKMFLEEQRMKSLAEIEAVM